MSDAQKILTGVVVIAVLVLITIYAATAISKAQQNNHPQRIQNGQVVSCPQVPEPLCMNGTDCC